jgi:hypothetical protein
MTLDAALDRLIHRRSCRSAFLAGERTSELSEAEFADLRTIDAQVLSELAARVAGEVFTRKHTGSGSLLDLYPRTIDSFRAEHGGDDALLELAFAFMESPSFERYRELPHAGRGLSLEEAFFRHAEAEGIGDPGAREAEFLAAVAKLLCANPRADATLPTELRRTGAGYYAVSTRGAPTLYGALRGRFVTGPLTPFLADLLEAGANPERTAVRHRVPRVVLTESLRHLAVLGIF